MIRVTMLAPNRALVERRSLVDLLVGRAGNDRRAYLANAGRWHFDCSGHWVGMRVQRAIEGALRRERVRLLARSTAPPS